MKASVSVVIPTFDRVTELERALDSVYAQTLAANEVVVVDDGSADTTPSMMKNRFPNARYIRQSNSGVSAARNRGINAAGCEWIALLDSDDEWTPAKLAQQLAALEQQPEYKICHTDEIWIRNGVRVNAGLRHAKRGGWIFRDCLPLCAISPSSVLIHRSVFDRVGLFDESLPACEDYDLWLRICSTYPVLYVDQKLTLKYGGHDNQLSRRYWGMDRFRIKALQRIITSGQLNSSDSQAATATLRQKIGVYLQGARKRQKHDEVAYYQDILDRFQSNDPSRHRAAV